MIIQQRLDETSYEVKDDLMRDMIIFGVNRNALYDAVNPYEKLIGIILEIETAEMEND